METIVCDWDDCTFFLEKPFPERAPKSDAKLYEMWLNNSPLARERLFVIIVIFPFSPI